MDEVVKNTHAFIDILCMARGEAVQGWDEDTFHRAFKWTQYFEQVHSKLKSKPGLVDKLDRYINNFNKATSVSLGTLKMSFNQLAHSKRILITSLLQNPYLSSQQLSNVLKLYRVNIGAQNESNDLEILQKDVTDLMSQKGTLKILSLMQNELIKDFEKSPVGSCDNNVEVTGTAAVDICMMSDAVARQATGELLFNYVLHTMEISGRGDEFIDDKLDVISTLDDGMQIIASCLLYLPDDCQSPGKASMVQAYVLTWLLDKIKQNPAHHPIWTLDVQHLSALAYKYEDILMVYLNQLTSCANKMIPVLSFQKTTQETSLPRHGHVIYVWRSSENCGIIRETGGFETLVQHFLCLFQGPQHVQELCNKTIQNNMNCYDTSNANQELTSQLGVNVWKDLYKALPNEDVQ